MLKSYIDDLPKSFNYVDMSMITDKDGQEYKGCQQARYGFVYEI